MQPQTPPDKRSVPLECKALIELFESVEPFASSRLEIAIQLRDPNAVTLFRHLDNVVILENTSGDIAIRRRLY